MHEKKRQPRKYEDTTSSLLERNTSSGNPGLTMPCIEVSQNKAIDELEEIRVKRNTKEDLHCSPSMHTMYRILRRQIDWLQSGTQFQCCYKISRCASMAASPTIGDVKFLNKLARQIKSQTSFNTGHSLDQ